ncbi:MAG TPA: MBL fold metallo-hydrolase [Candidatus Limnocylindrales bacterium]|nr:MBL fold metallo-hydrolase [Candidatus Limnocylindrales bacterium]
MPALRCTLVGIGAIASPKYRPAGLLVSAGTWRVMLDGGPGAEPDGTIDAWLVSDADSELRTTIRRLGAARGVKPAVAAFDRPDLSIQPRPVVHTSHPTFGYLIEVRGRRVVWAPEFMVFPDWAAGADLMFAEASGWARPIRFARGTGGHAPVLETDRVAREAGVRRLVFAHIGRPTIRALVDGLTPPFGEIGVEGRTYEVD